MSTEALDLANVQSDQQPISQDPAGAEKEVPFGTTQTVEAP